MAEVIPITPGSPEIRLRTRLDGRFYRLILKWQTRDSVWSLDLETNDGAALLRGQTVTVNHDLLWAHTAADLPPGALVPVDLTGRFVNPTMTDIGERVVLVYLTAAEVAALAA